MSEKRRYYSLFPKTLSNCVEPLTRPVLKERGLASARLITGWSDIIGRPLADHCLPEKLSFPPGKKTDGTLTVAVENGFATDIQHMQPYILERLASYFGYRAVNRLVISHSFQSNKKPAPKKSVPSNPELKPVITSDIDDPELKEALESLARAMTQPTA